MTEQKDQVNPKDKWKFDEEVTQCFDNMLERSIPQYKVMRKTVFDIACEFQQDELAIMDLGTSLGNSLAPLVKKFKKRNYYTGLEISPEMIKKARQRFQKEIKEGYVEIYKCDLRKGVPQNPSCIVMSILTIQFTPMEYRPHIISSVYKTLHPGGAFIFVEKVLGQTSQVDRLMTDIYYGLKGSNGYTEEQIERKRLSLEGVLVPVTAKWNEEMLHWAGFKQVECFWRWMNFAGWVGIK